MKLLGALDERMSKPLHFAEVKKITGWNNRKTTDLLTKAVKEGYVEKHKVGHATLYRSKIADYKGYFDALQFLTRVDWINRRNGTVLSTDVPLALFSRCHVLAYGIPPTKKLTPLEEEMLFTILSRMSFAFSDYTSLSDAIQKRQRWEEAGCLPLSVKSAMFSHEEREESLPLDVRAASKIYGDVIWEHIFTKISRDIRFALEKGSMDFTGPIELLNCNPYFAKLALKLAKKIYAGELSDYDETDPETTKKLAAMNRHEDSFSEGAKDLAVLVTPSPESLDEFANQVGKIVKDAFDVWSTEDFMESSIKTKGETLWEDVFDFGDGQHHVRRDMLREGICDTLASMRSGYGEPISASDRKFMLRDRNLTDVFSSDVIRAMISKIEDVIRRANKFYCMIEKGQALDEIRKDPEWFTDEELHEFHLAQKVYTAAEWERSFGTLGPVSFEFRRDSKETDEIAKGYQARVRTELNGGKPKLKKKGKSMANGEKKRNL